MRKLESFSSGIVQKKICYHHPHTKITLGIEVNLMLSYHWITKGGSHRSCWDMVLTCMLSLSELRDKQQTITSIIEGGGV